MASMVVDFLSAVAGDWVVWSRVYGSEEEVYCGEWDGQYKWYGRARGERKREMCHRVEGSGTVEVGASCVVLTARCSTAPAPAPSPAGDPET